MQAAVDATTHLDADQRHALVNGEFAPYYQPMVDTPYRQMPFDRLFLATYP